MTNFHISDCDDSIGFWCMLKRKLIYISYFSNPIRQLFLQTLSQNFKLLVIHHKSVPKRRNKRFSRYHSIFQRNWRKDSKKYSTFFLLLPSGAWNTEHPLQSLAQNGGDWIGHQKNFSISENGVETELFFVLDYWHSQTINSEAATTP